ncbi:MAG: VanZ family protein [Acidobacteriota bacterium]|jgi:VanZ family protein
MKFARGGSLWGPPVLYLSLIFALSSMSNPPVPAWVDQNLLHYPEYALLAFLVIRAFQGTWTRMGALPLSILALGFTTIWGATDELHQAFVPRRVPDPLDWWHDIIGATAGILIWWGWHFIWSRRSSRPSS